VLGLLLLRLALLLLVLRGLALLARLAVHHCRRRCQPLQLPAMRDWPAAVRRLQESWLAAQLRQLGGSR
jgi:hypothetical protein